MGGFARPFMRGGRPDSGMLTSKVEWFKVQPWSRPDFCNRTTLFQLWNAVSIISVRTLLTSCRFPHVASAGEAGRLQVSGRLYFGNGTVILLRPNSLPVALLLNIYPLQIIYET